MARERLTFRQRDVTAAVQALKRAGCDVSRIRVRIEKDGSIMVELVPLAASETAPEPDINPWDEVDLSYGKKPR
jgi:trimethylamine:corrinoid methyltransferase-like protein